MSSLFSGSVFTYLTQGMDAAALRQRVHAHNLANVNTPNFKRSHVQFESILKSNLASGAPKLAVTKPAHIAAGGNSSNGNTRMVQDQSTSMRSDGNNVDVDREMSELTINQLNYNALTQQLNERLGIMRYVINEGRR